MNPSLTAIDPAVLTLPPPDSTREGCYRPGDPRLPTGAYQPGAPLRTAHDTRSALAGAVLRRAVRIGIMLGAPLATFARSIIVAPAGKPWSYLTLARYVAQDLTTTANLARESRLCGLSRTILAARSLTRRPLTDALSAEEHWCLAVEDCAGLSALMLTLDPILDATAEARLVVDLLPGFRACTVEYAAPGVVMLRDADGWGHKLLGRVHSAL